MIISLMRKKIFKTFGDFSKNYKHLTKHVVFINHSDFKFNDKTIFSKYKGYSVLLISIWFDGSKLQQERLYPLDFIEKLND